MTQPLLVQILFHAKSAAARACAQSLYRALNNDPALPGLRVPVVFAPERPDHAPPTQLDFDQGERNFVVVLADDELNADEKWCRFVGDQWERCATQPSAHLLPLQLSPHAFPLDDRLARTSFCRAWAVAQDERQRWIDNRVVLELLRFLADDENGDQAPIQLFLSHAKMDIGSPPQVFKAICDYLDASKPVRKWIDSAAIPGGSRFDEEIKRGVRDSALLVILTDNYSTRSWCRREVLLAKERRRPLVVIDALQDTELRSFPYLGNVPVRRWTKRLPPAQAAARSVDLLIKETLRHRVTSLWLEAVKTPDDLVLVSPPELVNLRHILPKHTILYADPALSDEERDVFAGLPLRDGQALRLETPMQRKVAAGGLAGKTVALSTSETADLADSGLFEAHFDDLLLTISRELLLRGAKLAYGGHLGKDSYTLALFELARTYRNQEGIPPVEKIVNYVGWPLTVTPTQVSQFKNQANLVRVVRPEGVADLEPETFIEEPTFFQDDSPERRYAWARGMTAMREQQAAEVDARVVIGGGVGPTLGVTPEGVRQLKWYKSRIPGVLEELLLSLERKQPVYLVGAFGGVGRLAVDLIEGRPRPEMSWEFQRAAPHAEGMRALHEVRGEWRDYAEMAKQIVAAGVDGLHNGLSPEENRELWRSRDIERITALVVEGLLRQFNDGEPL